MSIILTILSVDKVRAGFRKQLKAIHDTCVYIVQAELANCRENSYPNLYQRSVHFVMYIKLYKKLHSVLFALSVSVVIIL